MTWLQRAFDGHVPAFLAALDQALEGATEEIVDLSDLDLLDDDQGHAVCRHCLPLEVRPLDLVPTICGLRLPIGLGGTGITCEPCKQAFEAQVCPVHGWTW